MCPLFWGPKTGYGLGSVGGGLPSSKKMKRKPATLRRADLIHERRPVRRIMGCHSVQLGHDCAHEVQDPNRFSQTGSGSTKEHLATYRCCANTKQKQRRNRGNKVKSKPDSVGQWHLKGDMPLYVVAQQRVEG